MSTVRVANRGRCLQHERGWTVEAMRQGATDLGLSPAIVTKYERPQASLVFVSLPVVTSNLILGFSSSDPSAMLAFVRLASVRDSQ